MAVIGEALRACRNIRRCPPDEQRDMHHAQFKQDEAQERARHYLGQSILQRNAAAPGGQHMAARHSKPQRPGQPERGEQARHVENTLAYSGRSADDHDDAAQSGRAQHGMQVGPLLRRFGDSRETQRVDHDPCEKQRGKRHIGRRPLGVSHQPGQPDGDDGKPEDRIFASQRERSGADHGFCHSTFVPGCPAKCLRIHYRRCRDGARCSTWWLFAKKRDGKALSSPLPPAGARNGKWQVVRAYLFHHIDIHGTFTPVLFCKTALSVSHPAATIAS